MNVGLLTYYRSNVFGGYWQSLSHLQALSKLPDVSNVSLIPILHTTRLQKLRGIQKRPRHIIQSLKRHIDYHVQRKNNIGEFLLDGYINLHDNEALSNYVTNNNIHLLITGADTCLNLTKEDIQKRKIPVYWPNPSRNVNHATFSASCGDLSINSLSSGLYDHLGEGISKSSYLGFRDKSTEVLFSHLNSKNIPLSFTPDPAFWGFQKELCSSRRINTPFKNKNSVCLISAIGCEIDEEIIKFIGRKFNIINLNTLSLQGFSVEFPGPIEHLHLINNSGFLITSSFHETIAAAISGVPFIAIERPLTRGRPFGITKLSDLCNRLGCTSQYIDPINNLLLDTTDNRNIKNIFNQSMENIKSNKAAAEQMASLFELKLRHFIANI